MVNRNGLCHKGGNWGSDVSITAADPWGRTQVQATCVGYSVLPALRAVGAEPVNERATIFLICFSPDEIFTTPCGTR